jgi:hypothetical protein
MISSLRPGVSYALRYPPVPSRVPIFKTTLTDTTDADTSTFTEVDIGVPHPRRVVILATMHGVIANVTATVQGSLGRVSSASQSSRYTSIMSYRVPKGFTTEIVVTSAASLRKAVGVFVAYPLSHLIESSDDTTQATTTDAVLTVNGMADGFVIYSGAQLNILGAFGATWSGTDAAVESVDAQLEATSSYSFGYVPLTQTLVGATLTIAETTSGTKHATAAAFH